MATGTPKHRIRVESEIERNREEGNWSRCLELSAQLSQDQGQLTQFLMGEAKLEKFLDSSKEKSAASLLTEAKKHLTSCLAPAGGPLSMDANLLLSKAYYVSGEYAAALRFIEESGIEAVTKVEKPLPLRVMKLVAESFAVKGMCLDKEYGHETETEDTKTTYLVKATDLSLRYLQNMDKQYVPYVSFQLGTILETAIQKAPMLHVQNKKLEQAVGLYRSFMNAVENPSSLNLRQFMSRQLVETILRGVSRSRWPKFDGHMTTVVGPWKPVRYFGQSLFVPREREEEILLFLLISEGLAARNVVLERSPEFNDTRNQSLQAVTAIYDLMTLTFVPLRVYYSDCFERAMKFSYQAKHVWFQFGLTLMQSKRCPARALQVLVQTGQMDKTDPVPLLLASRICIEDLDDAHQALSLAHEAMSRIKESDSLYSRAALVIGIANAVIYESATDAIRKLNEHHLKEAEKYFLMAMNANPNDHLPYMHLSLLMGHQRRIQKAFTLAQIAIHLNPSHLPSIQLLILCLTSLHQHQEAMDLCDVALMEFPDNLILLFIKSHLEQEVFEDGREQALLTAKHMLRCYRRLSSNGSQVEDMGYQSDTYQKTSLLTGANYDNLSLRMEQTLSEVTSMDSGPGQSYGMAGIGGQTDCLSHASHTSLGKSKQMWTLHLHIWLHVVELFIQMDQLSDAESCITDAVSTIFGPLSHQLMYAKGLLAKAKGSLLEAQTFLQNAISINAKHAKALQQLGHLYFLLGNHLSADKYLNDSLRIDSSLHETWSFMAVNHDAIGEAGHAVRCQAQALRLESTAPILPFNIVPRPVFD